jgi:hypothetical protein
MRINRYFILAMFDLCNFLFILFKVNGLVVSRIMRSRNLKEPDSGVIESGVLKGQCHEIFDPRFFFLIKTSVLDP